MSEDTPVNTGVSWPDPDEADRLVRRMQVKLHHWAAADRGRRFHDLFNLVYDPAFLTAAWQRLSTNAGARTPGVDKVTVSFIANRVGVPTFLDHVQGQASSTVDVRTRSGPVVPVRKTRHRHRVGNGVALARPSERSEPLDSPGCQSPSDHSASPMAEAASTCDHDAMAGLLAWIRMAIGRGRPLPADQLSQARRREVGAFAYQQADSLREGKLTHAQAIDAIAEQFPELGREQAARALANGLYESLW